MLFSASGKKLIVLGDDGAIRLYDIVETKAVPLKVLESAHADHIRCGDTSKTSDLLFATGFLFIFYIDDSYFKTDT